MFVELCDGYEPARCPGWSRTLGMFAMAALRPGSVPRPVSRAHSAARSVPSPVPVLPSARAPPSLRAEGTRARSALRLVARPMPGARGYGAGWGWGWGACYPNVMRGFHKNLPVFGSYSKTSLRRSNVSVVALVTLTLSMFNSFHGTLQNSPSAASHSS